MDTLFVYGTLLVDVIMNRVTGKRFKCCKATLHNHAAFRLRNEPYPSIIYRKGSTVEGRVYFDIDEDSLQRIDAFEGDHYERTVVDIITDGGEQNASYVYRLKEGYTIYWPMNRGISGDS